MFSGGLHLQPGGGGHGPLVPLGYGSAGVAAMQGVRRSCTQIPSPRPRISLTFSNGAVSVGLQQLAEAEAASEQQHRQQQ